MHRTQAEALLQAILSSPEGLNLAQLLARFPDVSRRSAQRWLGQWSAAGQVQAVGKGPARRYMPPQRRYTPWHELAPAAQVLLAAEPGSGSVPDFSPFPAAIPLSIDSRDVLAYVSQPRAGRHPVGYQIEFLQEYEPNVSAYLPAPVRRQLHQIGRTDQAAAPAGTYTRAILNRLLIDLSWASSHLEGNTYSRLDTSKLIEMGRAADGKAVLETQMILNHKAAIELLVDNIDTAGFDRYTLMNLHSALAENLMPNPEDEGRVRDQVVYIGQSVYRPLGTPAQIEAALDMLLDKAARIEDPFEQSFFAMVHLPYLQPFSDVNKRTSRLAANLPLFRANLCPLTFLDVPVAAYSLATLGVYEMTRVELLRDVYVWAYQRSTREYLMLRQELAQPDPMRLIWRDVIRQVVREVVRQPDADAMDIVAQLVARHVPAADRPEVQAMVIQELGRLQEGVLVLYGLRPAEFERWRRR